MHTFLVSDLHGNTEKYIKLFDVISKKKPALVFIAGDLTNHIKNVSATSTQNFYKDFLKEQFSILKETLKDSYPKV